MESITNQQLQKDLTMKFDSLEELMVEFQSLNDENCLDWRRIQKKGSQISCGEEMLQFLRSKERLKWESKSKKGEVKIEFDGIPYLVAEWESYICQQGPDPDKQRKEKRIAENEEYMKGDHVQHVKHKKNRQSSKFCDCPAKVEITHLIKLNGYQASCGTGRKKKSIAHNFHEHISQMQDCDQMNRVIQPKSVYILTMSPASAHKGHRTSGMTAERRRKTDKTVIQKVREMAKDGVRCVDEASRHLKSFVKREMGKESDSKLSHKVYPSDRDLFNILGSVKAGNRKAPDDQINLQIRMKEWAVENDKYFLRLSTRQDHLTNGEKFLFVYQSGWQRRLLSLYGNSLTLLDATYKTCRYDVPLFFLCVQTNVKYVVVAAFIVENEDMASIKEALEKIKEWNPSWNPRNWMVDYSLAEINALEQEFPESNVVLCDFHRLKAWKNYVTKTEHGLSNNYDEVMKLMRAIGESPSVQAYEKSTNALKSSPLWLNNKGFQKYYENQWEKVHTKWVRCFLDPMLNVYTNNGIERQNGIFKSKHLKGYKNCTMSDLVEVLVKTFFPISYTSYCNENVIRASGYRKYVTSAPQYLHNRPTMFFDHVMQAIEKRDFDCSKIEKLSAITFKVPSGTNSTDSYEVCLGDCDRMPSCSCYQWKKTKLPCKHLMAVITTVQGVKWEDLPKRYRNNQLFVLDPALVDKEDAISMDSYNVNTEKPLNEDETNRMEEEETEESRVDELPSRRKPDPLKKALNTAVILCNQLISALYEAEDEGDINTVSDSIRESIQKLRSTTKMEAGLPRRKQEPKNTKARPVANKRKHDGGLRMHKGKDKVQGRVGVYADMIRKARVISVHDDEDDFMPTKKKFKRSSKKKTNREDKKLWNNDFSDLDNPDMWLNDLHINRSLSIMKQDYPRIGGLNDIYNTPIPVPTSQNKHVQIHHVNGNHWITSAFINGTVLVYDSLHTSLSADGAKQIKNLYSNFIGEDGFLSVCCVRYQKQNGANDCGLFAIANAMALCQGGMLSYWNQQEMRVHLKHCLQNMKMEIFPSTRRNPGDHVSHNTIKV